MAGTAQDACEQGSRYVRQARDQYPEVEQYIGERQQAVTHRVTQNPLLALFMAGVAGYALAWLIQVNGQTERPTCRSMNGPVAETLPTVNADQPRLLLNG